MLKKKSLYHKKSNWHLLSTVVHLPTCANSRHYSEQSAWEDAGVKVRHVLTLTEGHLPYPRDCESLTGNSHVDVRVLLLRTVTEAVFTQSPQHPNQHGECSTAATDGFYWFKTHELCSEAGTPRVTDLRLPRRRQCYAVLAGLVLQLEAQNTGRMDLNKHIGSAVRRECPFLLFQYLCIIKLIQIILKKKKKSRAIPAVVSESKPVEVPRAGEHQHPGSVWCCCQASLEMQLPEFLAVGDCDCHSWFPGFHVRGDGAALGQPFEPFVGVIEENPVFGFVVGLCGVRH